MILMSFYFLHLCIYPFAVPVLSLLSQSFFFFFLIFVCVCVCVLSCFNHFQLCDPMTAACQSPLSMGSSRHEFSSGLACLPRELSNPGIEPRSLMSLTLAGRVFFLFLGGFFVCFFTTSTTWEALLICILADLNDLFPSCDFLLQISSCFVFYVEMTFLYFF